MTLEWTSMQHLIESGDVDQLLHATEELTEAQRRALAASLREHMARWRTGVAWPDSVTFTDRWARRRRQATALAVVGGLCLATPAAVATWLTRADGDHFEPGPALLALRRLAGRVSGQGRVPVGCGGPDEQSTGD